MCYHIRCYEDNSGDGNTCHKLATKYNAVTLSLKLDQATVIIIYHFRLPIRLYHTLAGMC